MAYLFMCGTRKLVAKTCKGCGELKMGAQFHRASEGHYATNCKPCQHKAASQHSQKTNEASLEKATQHYVEWTSDETDTMWRLTDLGLSTRDIAERLGRTESAILAHRTRTRNACGTVVHLKYYDGRADAVFTVGKPYYLDVKGHPGRLHTAASHLAELHTQLIFFIEVDEGGEYMGIRGLDALKEGDDREPEDTSEDLDAGVIS